MGFRNALEWPGPWFEPKGDFGEGCSGYVPAVDEMGYDGADVVDLSARLVGIVEPGAAGRVGVFTGGAGLVAVGLCVAKLSQ